MEFKKKVAAFLKSEKGGVSKKALIEGALASGIIFALSQAASAQWTHTNTASITGLSCDPAAPTCNTATVSASHTNHQNHSNHSNY